MKIQERLALYAPVRLKVDLGTLSASDRKIIPLLIEAAQAMDDAFWSQMIDSREALMASTTDPDTLRLLKLSYGPWDVLHDDEPFIDGVGKMPPGANFYPLDMTAEEFESQTAANPELSSLFSMVRRDDQGQLVAIPFHQFFYTQVRLAADRLQQASSLAEDAGLKEYLCLRAEALLTDDYRQSEYAWMAMQENNLDILIGPMETSADRLLDGKASYAATILVKDWDWSKRLASTIAALPQLQAELPVPAAYRRGQPGLDSDLYVYDVLYCAGYDNSSVPIGVSWPNDEEVRERKGARTLLLKNVMRAKFEKLIRPMTGLMIASDQVAHITFEAFFDFVMFHEIGHSLGLLHTINGNGTVKEAMKDYAHVIEECKANVLSMLVNQRLGSQAGTAWTDFHVTFLADHLRRYDSRQALVLLNFFKEMGAYTRDAASNTYRINPERIPAAVTALAERLLTLQGDGDYAAAKAFVDRYAEPDEDLKADIERIEAMALPAEIVLDQDAVL